MELEYLRSSFGFLYETVLAIFFLCLKQKEVLRSWPQRIVGGTFLLSTAWLFIFYSPGTSFLFETTIRFLYRVIAYTSFLAFCFHINKRRAIYFALFCACTFNICHSVMRAPGLVGLARATVKLAEHPTVNVFLCTTVTYLFFFAVFAIVFIVVPFDRIHGIAGVHFVVLSIVSVSTIYLRYSLELIYINGSLYDKQICIYIIILAFFCLAFLCLFERYMVAREEQFQGTLQAMANEYRLKALEQQQEKEKEILTLWHDMKHHMAAIQLMAIKRDDEQILKYVKDLLGEIGICEKRLSTGIPILNGLFSEKIDDARREKIQMSVDLNAAALKFISDVDLCTIFGNALDNAIEACKKKEETEKRFIVVSAQHLAGCIVINIANSYAGRIKMSNGLPVTSKEDAAFHGLGLYSIKKTLEKYNSQMVMDTKSPGVFRLTFVIPIP